ncbi:MAG: ribosome maturation factor RimP [Sulfurimicrobium sp.]|nr:ribosome maturation factor RimP [Sulfurimicrobium sp.]MDO9190073.1 ribosome maturation factor RimP [Sulfurimicrobium sp.]MDP2198231.1 ribosome maturation factor RimP [Sulfurimicrobium sp.]MDP3686932.1 ribosome maturation factor RimP [Sulfurimicrobium sp.]
MELYSLLESTLSGLGYELVDLEISNRGKLLRLFIDKPEGINIDDCSLVSNHISRLLAVEMDFDYDRLEVSSPGLDRPLKKISDFMRFKDQAAVVKLRVPLQGRKKFEGVLRGVEEGKLLIEIDESIVRLDLDNIDKARLVPIF